MPPKKKDNPKTVQPWDYRERWHDAITAWREENGRTNSDLARAIGKSLSHISATISGQKIPSLEIIIAVSNVLGVSPMEFTDDEGLRELLGRYGLDKDRLTAAIVPLEHVCKVLKRNPDPVTKARLIYSIYKEASKSQGKWKAPSEEQILGFVRMRA